MRSEQTLEMADMFTQTKTGDWLRSSKEKIDRAQTVAQEQVVLQLPSDFLKTPITTYQPEYCEFTLPDGSIEFLKLQAQLEGIDGRSLLLAAFNALLYRYTQQESIYLQLTIADDKIEDYTTQICTQISGELKVRELIDRVSVAVQSIQGKSGVSKERSLTDSNFNQQSNLPIAITFIENFFHTEDKQQWVTEAQQTTSNTDNPDLHLVILQQEQSISGILKYNGNLFKLDTIERLAAHLQVLVEGIVNDLNCPIAQLPLLTRAEERQLLVEWQGAPVNYPQVPIHKYIESYAIRQPDAIALTFKERQLTYATLNQYANQLADYLTSVGVGREVRVAVCVEPSLEIAVSLVAILKAGGVYVPLDPTHPAERLAVILEEIQPKVLLTQSHLLPNLPALAEHTFCLDKNWETIQHLPTHNLEIEIHSEQTAYVVYTSGTTGKPKGVMTSHGNLVNYILAAQEQFGFNRDVVMPAIARFTFSITMFELLSPLVAGGTLIILEREHILDFKRMAQTLEQVTVVHMSPSLMRNLLAYIQENDIDIQKFQGLKHVSSGGDMVPADLLETMKNVFQNAEVCVIYGCSEISCMGCSYPVARRIVTNSLVGKPFNNVSVRLYDPYQNLVPIGIVGEIYFSSAGVTKGYLDREELTQEKFVTIDGQKFYKTGDLGRFDADGNLEILGRADYQIKLRGIRIEPGEIEAVLRQVPGVREGIVAVRELRNGEKSLIGYVILERSQKPAIAEIRSFLQTKLPQYMVPAIFVELEAMPLNVNQKVDRRALPAPDLTRPSLENTSYLACKSPLEEQLAGIWAKILGLEQVGIHDNFFALGGHSLLAAQVVHRLQETLKLEISINKLFELPTVDVLAEYLATLKQTNRNSFGLAPITPIQRQAYLPLSLSQSRMWFLTQLEEGVAYNIPLVLQLVGTLDLTILKQSLTEIVRRHEALRTCFPVVDGAPVQLILPPQQFSLPVVDLLARSRQEQTMEVYRLAKEEAQLPFNLAKDLPIRGTLLQLEETSHVLLLTVHHIAADGWSLAILRKELAALYTAFLQETASPLKELPIQYADFAHWQRQWLKEEILRKQLAYWKLQLAGVPPLLELPCDRPRPPVQSYRGGTEFFTLDVELTCQLKTLSLHTGTTLFMILLTAFATLLSRYSKHEDLAIGSPIANRNHSDIEPLIACFINLLVLRIDLTGNPNFLDLLQRVKQVCLDAYANQDAPFDQLVEALQLERNPSHSPLFQVLFILQNSPTEQLDLPGLTLTTLKVESGTAKYDLTLMMEETEDGLTAEFEYNRDLFDRATIVRAIGHFQMLLQGIVTDSKQPILSLPLLTQSESHQLLVEWNNTRMEYPQLCIHQLFETQVEKTPDAIALVFGQDYLTYQELNYRANQLARYLQSLGVGPEVLVGICVECSLEMVVGLLGILKAGGSYVPLDPAYPRERLTYMIEDSQLFLLLTQQAFRDRFLEQNVQILCIDTDWGAIAQQSNKNLNSGVTSKNLAYTIYTSGSTGKPKGVQICHRTAVNFLNSMHHKPGLTDRDILLAVTTISFDIAVLELYLPLSVGARAVLAPREVTTDSARLSELLTQSGATVMQATPATWHMLLAGGWQGDRRLKMLCGGEAMSRELADRLLARGSSLWNMYGPTETTVWSAACQVEPGKGSVPVADPIANTQIYVLEESPEGSVRPVPIGIPGEVHIGGDGLARGYLNRPELTQQRFIDNPFSDKPGVRLYKTGDLARFRPDGTLEFLGRIDNQVKLRGFRIELAEIEAVLNRHAAVKQNVVAIREDIPGDRRLIAYLTTKDDAIPTSVELRHFLKDCLPNYMVPSTFVVLDTLPLTPNGKVDRRALPTPELSSASDRSCTFVAPIDELEYRLVEIWEEVLRVKPIGIQDNFFDLGGYSLLAVHLFARIEQSLGVNLPLVTLLQAPTIEQMANLLRRSDWIAPWHSLIPLQTSGSQLPLFCLHGGGFNVLIYRNLAIGLGSDRPVYALQAQGLDGISKPHSRIEDMAADYIKQIRTVQPRGPYLLAGLSNGGVIALEMAQQLQRQGEKVALVAMFDTYGPVERQFLPPLPRLASVCNYVIRYMLPRFIAKHWRSGFKTTSTQIFTKFNKGKQQSDRPTSSLEYSSRNRDRATISLGKLSNINIENWIHKLNVFVLNHSSWAFYSPSEELVDIDGTQSQTVQQIEAAHRQANQKYVPSPYIGRITIFEASEQPPGFAKALQYGWKNIAVGEMDIHRVPGDHLTIMQSSVLVEKLKTSIYKALINT